jgi:integrase/recombinase XerD
MATDFAGFLRRFLISHVAGLHGCSPNTVASYRDTFKLLIAWFCTKAGPAGQAHLNHVDIGTVTAFLAYLRDSRHNGLTTRNQRLAAISSFCTGMQTEDPARMACWQDILVIPAKKQDHPAVSYLTVAQARLLLAQPDRSTHQGRRDATLLATLYDTGARVQGPGTRRPRRPRHPPPEPDHGHTLTGKGRKTRHVPPAGTPSRCWSLT